MNRTVLLALALAALTSTAVPEAHGLTRTCGPDPVANTAAVLCAPPSGPCDGSTVVVGTSIGVKDTGCRFDLGGRALRIERTLQVPGNDTLLDGRIAVENAGDITIAKHGRLKARGDFVRPSGSIIGGGRIELRSTGTIRVAGILDVSGDSAGTIVLTATADVVLERSAKIRGNGISSFADAGKRSSNGGSFQVHSDAGSIVLGAQVQLRGANGATGGDVLLAAARNIEIHGKTDVSGGASGGGSLWAVSGDHLRVARASINARSRGGGDWGGDIWFFAGNDGLNDAVPGGMLSLDATILDASGSANDEGFAGGGGWIEVWAYGPVTIAPDVTIRADGATSPDNPDGLGGVIFLTAADVFRDDDSGQTPPNSDLLVAGHISVRGGRRGGDGGDLEAVSARDLVLAATIDVGGKDLAGNVLATAGRTLHLGGPLAAEVERAGGEGGTILLAAGRRQVGALTIAADILAAGGAHNDTGPIINLSGCPLTVADGVTIDARGGIGPGGLPGTSKLELISGRPLQLGAGSRYLAGPGGRVTVTHPPTLAPVVGAGALFDPPPLVDVVAASSLFPNCPRCGDGPGDACAPLVRIDAIVSDTGVVAATVALESPLGLPLSGSVEVCDGTGVEELTYTWLAESCAEPDTIEFSVNGTVVAAVSPEIDGCHCRCGCLAQATSYTVPLDEIRPLLVTGANRLGMRKSTGFPATVRTSLYWAYATITANGVPERVPLFDLPRFFEPLGTTHFDQLGCRILRTADAVDVSTEVQLCNDVAAVAWNGALPCGLDLSPLAPDHDYTLLIRAADGVVDPPAVATRDFTHGSEATLSLNGAPCQ